MDDKLDLVDIPGIEVYEDEEHNLILTFKERTTYEPGDKMTIWSSEIYQNGKENK